MSVFTLYSVESSIIMMHNINISALTPSDLTSTLLQFRSFKKHLLIGSQYYGNNLQSSDYDFMSMYWNAFPLTKLGFTPIDAYSEYGGIYELDRLTSEVLRKMVMDCYGNITNIDVQICNSQASFAKKWFLQENIKYKQLYKLPKVYFRNFVYEISNEIATSVKYTHDWSIQLYGQIEQVIKNWIIDIPVNRFYNLCSIIVRKNVTPFTKVSSMTLQPNYDLFAYLWNVKFGVN